MKDDRAWIALGTLVLSFIVFDLLTVTVLDIRVRAMSGTTSGLINGQVLLLAVWTAWGSAPISMRLLLGTVAGALLAVLAASRFGYYRGLSTGVATFVQWLSLHLALSLLRRVQGWRLILPGTLAPAAPTQGRLSILELFAWVAIIASTLGVIRAILGDEPDYAVRNALSAPFLSIVAARTVLSGGPIIFAIFASKWMPFWLVIAFACCIAMFAIEIAMSPGMSVRSFAWVKGAEFVVSAIGLLLVRFCGFRVNSTWSTDSVT